MPEAENWQRIEELGEGGQSSVWLVRSPERSSQLGISSRVIEQALAGTAKPDTFVQAMAEQLRPDRPEELGALKVFDKIREGGTAPTERIKREIEILREGHPGLPKLLASNADEKWMITELFPEGSLDKSPKHFEGDAPGAITAFRSLVETVAHLHRTGIIHRDIKPANIFLNGHKLIPGDFGIAYTDNNTSRLTVTHERVGPWDYMPQWADTGDRFDDVKPCFDVYMLGKLLWCMVSGRLRLPREYHRRPEFDLSNQFPNQREIESVNLILDKCIVEHANECVPSAVELLKIIDEMVEITKFHLRVDEKGAVEIPCLMCGHGFYIEETVNGRVNLPRSNNNNVQQQPILVRSFNCNVCAHKAFFAPGFPNEAAKRKWKRM